QFETATKLDPTDASAFYNLAHAYAMRGDPQKAEPMVRRSIELDDSGLDAHILLATILTAKRDWQEAVQELSQVIERDPDNAQACGGLGHCSQELGDVDESIYWLEQAILLDKHNPEWYFYQTFNYINKNDLDQALKYINSAIAKNDTISGYFILRGDILYNMGKQRKAKQDWKNALRLSDKLTHEVETRLSGQVPQIPRQQA
ncbi:tetratricopeptide repeat protein, partial [bacterium]|nr:tetratricopeptide repeat protein [bacterium]